ncbi:helix-turn-helix domain-containing protein [Corynebacterium vitaeruminis]|uniref:Transcriptional regulator n=1 Tax=Corynebacterium vitaeruminis DSM 20294 TaxID=1224164 RepID=W5Y2B8_9CORY|nr:helix-turn-helix transcriptional regulator [Corynebacterium vitaeruminis]AHI23381.1 transcriptional regulator [Corynebacterium vitaeruminis DSM 20294]
MTSALYRGDRQLTRFYLSRMSLPHDSLAIQRVPALMSQILAASMANYVPAALRIGASLLDYDATHDISHPGFWPWQDVYAQQLLLAGLDDQARELVDVTMDRTALSPIQSLMAKLGVPLANILIHRGEVTRGMRYFEEAVEQISPLGLPAYESRILYEYGRVLRRLGRRREAEGVFARAEEVFAAMGAAEFVERCRRERRVGGLTPHAPKDPLTAQEREIATRVAQGAINREVASDLFLSTKTVEYHLTNIYKKLGVRNRKELREKFAR